MLKPWQATPWDFGRKVHLHKLASMEHCDGHWLTTPLHEATRQALDLQAQAHTLSIVTTTDVGTFHQHDHSQPLSLGWTQQLTEGEAPSDDQPPQPAPLVSMVESPDLLRPEPIIFEQTFALKTTVFNDLLKSTFFEVLEQMLEAEPVSLNPKVKFEMAAPSDLTKREEAKDKRLSELNKSLEHHLIRKILGVNLQP